MKILSFLIILFCLSCHNSDESNPSTVPNSPIDPSKKKNKFLVESGRDVESLDTTILVDPEDFLRINLTMFPSFDEAHSINLDLIDKEISVYQMTQTNDNYITSEYFKLKNEEKDDYLYQQMKANKTKDFHFSLDQNEIKSLQNSLKSLKQSKYKVKSVEMMDGAAYYMSVYEKDTIVFMGTNSPSSHQTDFLIKLFEIVQNHANDSITRRNISNLRGYLPEKL